MHPIYQINSRSQPKSYPQHTILEEHRGAATFGHSKGKLNYGIAQFLLLGPLSANDYIDAEHYHHKQEEEHTPPENRLCPYLQGIQVEKTAFAFVVALQDSHIIYRQPLWKVSPKQSRPLIFWSRIIGPVTQEGNQDLYHIQSGNYGCQAENNIYCQKLRLREGMIRKPFLQR